MESGVEPFRRHRVPVQWPGLPHSGWQPEALLVGPQYKIGHLLLREGERSVVVRLIRIRFEERCRVGLESSIRTDATADSAKTEIDNLLNLHGLMILDDLNRKVVFNPQEKRRRTGVSRSAIEGMKGRHASFRDSLGGNPQGLQSSSSLRDCPGWARTCMAGSRITPVTSPDTCSTPSRSLRTFKNLEGQCI